MAAIPYLIAWEPGNLRAPRQLLGRDVPLERLTRAVLRKIDPAVVVLADSGCGKTALLHAWGQAALRGDIPALKDWAFVQLDIHGILADVVLGKIGTAAVMDTLK